ncbi:MAG: acyl-phosphate glycerol 3-phosphate acyltransferase [Acidobacteria bacterium RIFCSPLOWO2_02_FULL_67_36]|nr:MAG: acyl-phosphate glycerol 3-phosphate acyltransferase [Acidobacteria bacterium RIFCSPLOWO2_02_FULL_67_36]OFW18412.1 MAG: acyl-phosphate glycerol 3-phosphate acyltransferase [Acidobacteria bacterium RIFCSPLOWO2_12_FULL_66_21]
MLPVVIGYLAGSLPFAFLLARRAGIDVRLAGSGNVGAANVLRTTGTWRGVIVMSLDMLKGAAAVLVAYMSAGGAPVAALTGAAAVVGHIYPVWLRFHGGKGVAVAAGVFAVLAPLATAAAAAVFLIVVWTTRYVSLGSMAATVALPPAVWIVGAPTAVVGAAASVAGLILFRHRTNLQRLRMGTERRMGARA